MKLNCKPNDMAVVICGFPKMNIGKVIKVLKPNTAWDSTFWSYEGADIVCDFPFVGRAHYVDDRCLRPIRDQPGDDETLTIAGKPQSLPAPIMAKLTALTIDCATDDEAENAALRNPTWTANVREKGVIVATFYGEKVPAKRVKS